MDEHINRLSNAHTMEWAYVPEGNRVTYTMQLPSWEQCQQLLSSVSFELAHYSEFTDIMLSDWRRGAVGTYYNKKLQMGRWIRRIIDAKLEDSQRLTCWAEVSSKLHTSTQILLNESRTTNINDLIHRPSVENHIINTMRSTQHGE